MSVDWVLVSDVLSAVATVAIIILGSSGIIVTVTAIILIFISLVNFLHRKFTK